MMLCTHGRNTPLKVPSFTRVDVRRGVADWSSIPVDEKTRTGRPRESTDGENELSDETVSASPFCFIPGFPRSLRRKEGKRETVVAIGKPVQGRNEMICCVFFVTFCSWWTSHNNRQKSLQNGKGSLYQKTDMAATGPFTPQLSLYRLIFYKFRFSPGNESKQLPPYSYSARK